MLDGSTSGTGGATGPMGLPSAGRELLAGEEAGGVAAGATGVLAAAPARLPLAREGPASVAASGGH